MEPIHEEKRHGLTIKIYQDEDAQKPDDYGDDNALLVHYHRDCWIERYSILTEEDLAHIYQGNKTESVKELLKKYHVFPVSAYTHGGVALSLAHSLACDSAGWDTSHVGAVFLAKSEWKRRDKAAKYAQCLVDQWNDYLSGNVYGYVLEDSDGEHLDSCWGFYGDYDAKGGVLDEARAVADTYKDHEHDKQICAFAGVSI